MERYVIVNESFDKFRDKWNPPKNKTLSWYENVTYLIFKNTLLLHNCFQLLFCCNNLLILHGKLQSNQFLPQSLLFTFRFTYLARFSKLCATKCVAFKPFQFLTIICHMDIEFATSSSYHCFPALVWAYCQVV
jgi:hypothetical protein